MAKKGYIMTEEHKKKISDSKRGMKITWKCSKPFNSGHVPWNKGISIKLNDKLNEWRENGGIVWNKGLNGADNPNYGKKRSDEFRKKMSDIAKKRVAAGTHNLWNGGVANKNREERKIISDTVEYKIWRKSVFERDKYTCQLCLQVGGKLRADHIKPFSLFPELRMDLNNGRTLCDNCHKKTPTYGLNKVYQSRSVN